MAKRKVALNVILGKSPGATLAREGRKAYSFDAQREKCMARFDAKFGKGKWEVSSWCHGHHPNTVCLP